MAPKDAFPQLWERVRTSNGTVTVTDGPFTEAKEAIGGFAILQAESKQAAIELVKDFLKVVGEGECELRQIYEAPDQRPAEAACNTVNAAAR